MHDSAYINALWFCIKYCTPIENKLILDIGSADVGGCLQPIFAEGKYIGLDLSPNFNVDICANSHHLPFKDESFDIIVTSSCFEHDPMFWVTFLEMCRVLKTGGMMYINAPSSGWYHGYPVDCYRFLQDAWSGLAQWGCTKYSIKLVESYIDKDSPNWKDSVGIFQKEKNVP